MEMPRYKTLKVGSILLLFFLSFTLIARAFDIMACDICGKTIDKPFYWLEDLVLGKKVKVCAVCALESHCYLCGLPVLDGSKLLADGRHICARDLKDVVESEGDAREICSRVKDDLDRLLSRFLTMPVDGNIVLSITDKFHLENLFSAPGNENSCVSVYGATSTHSLGNHQFIHTVDILSNLPKPRLMAVCAHEYTHAWMGENVSNNRKVTLDKDTVEAFCELVAYVYMSSLNEENEIAHLKRNSYTRGQILVLIEAYNRYGFNTVMEWIKNGEDTKLDMNYLDRIRSLKDGETPRAAPVTPVLVFGNFKPAPAPTTLMLKSISGGSQRRFAMINDATFETMDHGKVRIGQTNVSVRCLEIRNDSVVIQIDGSPEKKQLFLRSAQ